MERRGLTDALKAAKEHRYDWLLAYRLDRFSLRIADLANLMDDLDAAGVHFRFATEPFDTSGAAGGCPFTCSARSRSSNAKSSSIA